MVIWINVYWLYYMQVQNCILIAKMLNTFHNTSFWREKKKLCIQICFTTCYSAVNFLLDIQHVLMTVEIRIRTPYLSVGDHAAGLHKTATLTEQDTFSTRSVVAWFAVTVWGSSSHSFMETVCLVWPTREKLLVGPAVWNWKRKSQLYLYTTLATLEGTYSSACHKTLIFNF